MKIKFEMSEENFRAFWAKIRDLTYQLEIHKLAFEKAKTALNEFPQTVHLLESLLLWSQQQPALYKSLHQGFDESVAQLLAAYRETGEPIDLEEFSKLFQAAVQNKLPH